MLETARVSTLPGGVKKKATSRSPAGDPQPEDHLPDDPPTTGAARAAIL